ncbi:helix-turn-helix domain-containing protein [Nocardia sp. SYP-A9097]|uniref:helix-turn-helix domain-containing protein n=1 Tax=Nocardia sp. SYP-A9097 TaxID=2663237 RepID=UPI0035C887BC
MERAGPSRENGASVAKFRARPGWVFQAYRFALDPSASVEQALRSHCGAARSTYNWAVDWVTAAWRQRAAERSYGIPDAQLTPAATVFPARATKGLQPDQAHRSTVRPLVARKLERGI